MEPYTTYMTQLQLEDSLFMELNTLRVIPINESFDNVKIMTNISKTIYNIVNTVLEFLKKVGKFINEKTIYLQKYLSSSKVISQAEYIMKTKDIESIQIKVDYIVSVGAVEDIQKLFLDKADLEGIVYNLTKILSKSKIDVDSIDSIKGNINLNTDWDDVAYNIAFSHQYGTVKGTFEDYISSKYIINNSANSMLCGQANIKYCIDTLKRATDNWNKVEKKRKNLTDKVEKLKDKLDSLEKRLSSEDIQKVSTIINNIMNTITKLYGGVSNSYQNIYVICINTLNTFIKTVNNKEEK